MNPNDDRGRLVYSTEVGKVCPECQKAVKECECAQQKKNVILGDGRVRVRLDTKGRGGKAVSVVSGLPLNEEQLQGLLKELKRSCGSGGTVKEGALEIQGDHVEALLKMLTTKGYSPKRSG